MKIKTKWDLSHLYKSNNDPKIEKDLKDAENSVAKFIKKYQGKTDYLSDSKKLKTAITDYFKVINLPGQTLPYRYYQLQIDIGENKEITTKKMGKLSLRLAELGNKTVFFSLSFKKINKENQRKFLRDPLLKEYHYFLKVLFEESKYLLDEPETKIARLLSRPASSIWQQGVAKTLDKKVIEFKGIEHNIASLSSLIPKLDKDERKKAHNILRSEVKTVADYAEGELNALCASRQIFDKLKGYKTPYHSQVISNEDDLKTIEHLADIVTKNFPIAHEFYKIKAKLLGLKNIEHQDRLAQIGEIKRKFTFNDSVEIFRTELNKLGSYYVNKFDQFLQNGQIDVFPQKGKRSGAYNWMSNLSSTVVLLNHTDDFDSLTTLAHEMGHAFHSELAKENQPDQYRGYTTSTAETASTFFENLVFQTIFNELSDQEKVIALHDRISGSIGTIFIQIAAFNFELEMHNTFRESGYLEHKEIAEILAKNLHACYGPIFKKNPDDGYGFISWSHFRTPFYVYTYAFGEIVSSALYQMYQENPDNFAKIEQFMKAGASKSPRDIFKSQGIDIRHPNFFQNGIDNVASEVKMLKKLSNKWKI